MKTKFIKKLLVTLFVLIFGLSAFASEKEDALKFFNHYVSVYNSYDSAELLKLYSSDAKIIRQLVLIKGYSADKDELVGVQTYSIEQSSQQIKFDSGIHKIYKYKRQYTDVVVEKVPNGYKISATVNGLPSIPNTKTYLIFQKQPNNKWLVIEEMVQLTSFYE